MSVEDWAAIRWCTGPRAGPSSSAQQQHPRSERCPHPRVGANLDHPDVDTDLGRRLQPSPPCRRRRLGYSCSSLPRLLRQLTDARVRPTN